MQVFGDMRKHDVRTGQVVAVLGVLRPRHDLADPVESRQLDVLVSARREPLPHGVDIPLAGRDAVLVPAEIELPPVQLAPIDGRRRRVGVHPVDHRVGQHHDDAPPGRSPADTPLGFGHAFVERVDAVALGEEVVDQFLPLLLPGSRSVPVARLEGVGPAVGAGGIHELQKDKPVEEPLLAAFLVGIGDIGSQPLPVPEERRAVVAAAVAQHGIGGYRPFAAALLPGAAFFPGRSSGALHGCASHRCDRNDCKGHRFEKSIHRSVEIFGFTINPAVKLGNISRRDQSTNNQVSNGFIRVRHPKHPRVFLDFGEPPVRT